MHKDQDREFGEKKKKLYCEGIKAKGNYNIHPQAATYFSIYTLN